MCHCHWSYTVVHLKLCLKTLVVTCVDLTEGEGVAIPSFSPSLTQLTSCYLGSFFVVVSF